MANPQIPIQQGGTLASLDERNTDIQDAQVQEQETEALADALGLEDTDAEQEVIELDDGSVVINFQDKKGPQQDPEFYANLAEEFDEGILDSLATEYLDYIEKEQGIKARQKLEADMTEQHRIRGEWM